MEITCPQCQQTLRVADTDAGKQARCPKCEAIFSIPGGAGAGGGVGSSPGGAANQAPGNNPLGGAPLGGNPLGGGGSPAPSHGSPAGGNSGSEELWHLKIEDGRSFGPVPKAELDSWLTENRITGNCQLRRDNDANWMPAGHVYHQLGSPSGQAANPFSDKYGAANPYQSNAGGFNSGQPTYQEPHRGGMILTFGILGLFGCGCIVFLGFGIAAIAMGANDMKKINQGLMDASGRGMTQAGYVMGIIGCIIAGLSMVLGFISVLADM